MTPLDTKGLRAKSVTLFRYKTTGDATYSEMANARATAQARSMPSMTEGRWLAAPDFDALLGELDALRSRAEGAEALLRLATKALVETARDGEVVSMGDCGVWFCEDDDGHEFWTLGEPGKPERRFATPEDAIDALLRPGGAAGGEVKRG